MSIINRVIPKATAINVIYGRGVTTIGWVLFSFLMIFSWIFGGSSDTSFIHFTGELNVTNGRIIEVVETNMEINEQSVWANVYEYTDEYGNEYILDAFTTGYSLPINKEVTVEYVIDSPEYGRIPGVRSAEFGSWGLLMYLLPIIGLSMIFYGIRRGYKDYNLLKIGEITKAKLVNKIPTNTEINAQTVYKLTFEFHDNNNKSYRKELKTHLTTRFEDDEFERLLYDPSDPAKSTLVDDLAGSPSIDDNGEFSALDTKLPIKPVLFPIVCITPHLWYLTTLV